MVVLSASYRFRCRFHLVVVVLISSLVASFALPIYSDPGLQAVVLTFLFLFLLESFLLVPFSWCIYIPT